MAEAKKISFGFSKISKKPAIVAPKKEEGGIQFIDCLEGNSIKLINGEDKAKEALVIPLKNGNALRDNMIEALKTRKEENILKNGISKGIENRPGDSENGVKNDAENKPLTLDELAAKEILEDLKKSSDAGESKDVREIPTTTSTAASSGEKESTLEDYENVPVVEFGLAMLRGMGWKPEVGVGKNGQVVQPTNPVLRPKGMGLGADRAAQPVAKSATGEELVMKKAALLKIVSGPYKNMYGKVEGFDELPGRIMVRLSVQNSVISISENLVQLVGKEEFNKNSKVLNLEDYNKYYEEKESKKKFENSINVEPFDNEQDESDRKRVAENVQESKNASQRRRDYSSSPERKEKYKAREKKNYSRKKKKASSDSDERYSEKRDNRCEKRYHMERRRNSSPESEERHWKKKHKRERRSSSSSEERSKSHKSNKRDPSSNSDEERSVSKSEQTSHSSKSKHKKSTYRDRSSSSESGGKKKSQSRTYESENKVSRHKHVKKDKNKSSDSNSDSGRKERGKHKSYSRQRSPSRKKKKKHHRSRS